jgi:phosphoglycolate phosphatase-like HAD superfamily hydrolase
MQVVELGGSPRVVEVVFLDCDGVIFDTNALKDRAMYEAAAGFPEAARQRLVEQHRAFGGVSRYEKLRWFFREVCPVADEEAAMSAALVRFTAVSEHGYDAIEPRAEALDFAARMGGAASVYVLSGSDEAELRRVFERRGLAARFAAVLGSPTGKRAHMEGVLRERGLAPTQALMVGDGRGDWEAARELGVPFVFLGEMSSWASAAADLAGAREAWVAARWSDLLGWCWEGAGRN